MASKTIGTVASIQAFQFLKQNFDEALAYLRAVGELIPTQDFKASILSQGWTTLDIPYSKLNRPP